MIKFDVGQHLTVHASNIVILCWQEICASLDKEDFIFYSVGDTAKEYMLLK